MRRIKWKNLGILVLVVTSVVYLIVAIVHFSSSEDTAKCEDVNVIIKDSSRLEFIRESDIRKLLHANSLNMKGKLLSEIDIEEIERTLEESPMIKKVVCFKNSTNDISLQIWQREPIFRVMGRENYYVDIEGKVLPISNHFVVHVPIVTGSVNKKFATGKLMEFVLFLRDNEFWNAQIEQIDVAPDSQIVLIPRVGRHEIILGELDGYQQKLKKLKTFYLNGLNKVGWGDYKSINLKYKNQVVCTKK